MARKSRQKTTEFVGLVGVGFDNEDGHERITKADEVLLVGGSQETHEQMQDVAIHVTETLKSKGKRVQDAEFEELVDLVRNAMDK